MSFAFSAINTAFRFSEFVIHLKEVGAENAVFVRTIQRVRHDLEETERLSKIPAVISMLSNNPEKAYWIEKAIFDTKTALNEIGLYVERARSDNDRDGTITFAHRVRWVLDDHGKLDNRRSELAACHQSLGTVLATLHPIEMLASFATAPPVHEDTSPPPQYVEGSFKSPYARKRNRKKALQTSAKQEMKLKMEECSATGYPSEIKQQVPPETKPDTTQCNTTTPSLQNQDSKAPHTIIQEKDINEPEVHSPLIDFEDHCTSSNSFGPVNSWDIWNNTNLFELPTDLKDSRAIETSALAHKEDPEVKVNDGKSVESNTVSKPLNRASGNQNDSRSLVAELAAFSIDFQDRSVNIIRNTFPHNPTNLACNELDADLPLANRNSLNHAKHSNPSIRPENNHSRPDFSKTRIPETFEMLAEVPIEMCGAESIPRAAYDPRQDWIASYISSQESKSQDSSMQEREQHFGEGSHRQSLPSEHIQHPEIQPQNNINAYYPYHQRRSLPMNNSLKQTQFPHSNVPMPIPPYPESPRLQPISPVEQIPHHLAHRSSDISMLSYTSREMTFSPISMPSTCPTPVNYPAHPSNDNNLSDNMWNSGMTLQRTPTRETEKRRRQRALMNAALTNLE